MLAWSGSSRQTVAAISYGRRLVQTPSRNHKSRHCRNVRFDRELMLVSQQQGTILASMTENIT